MSSNFGILGVANSGIGVYKTWLNAVADNVANMDNVTTTSAPAFQERFVNVGEIASSSPAGAGAQVTGVSFGDPNGRVTYEPDNPLADANGMVRHPDIDMSEQMVYMQMAQRGYQANVSSFQYARDAYETLLNIGKS
jgi:flagellar basal-body rod protein FlgC